MPRSIAVPPVIEPSGSLAVEERTLANGLKVLVLPRASSTVVVCDLFYPAGSVDEPPGLSGIAHFVEHMLFKGTTRFPKGAIDQLAAWYGGSANAETGEDFTHYWFALPAAGLELAFAIEADRMRAALFDPLEIDAERRVIEEERARELDSPLGRLDQTHQAVSFLKHPYRNPILGWPDDFRRLSAADLRRFHQRHYRPDGAVLVVVGDLEPGRVFKSVDAHFGRIPRGRPIAVEPSFDEPRSAGRFSFTLFEEGVSPRVILGWRTVPRGHPDAPALDVLSDLLGWGRRARLADRLVDRERIAGSIDVSHEVARFAGQFLILLEPTPTASARPQRIEAMIQEEIGRLARWGPTAAELSRSRRRLDASWRWEQEELHGLAAGLGQAALQGDWRLWRREHELALAVSATDLRRVASLYLVDERLTVGWLRPGRPQSHQLVFIDQGSPTVLPWPIPPSAFSDTASATKNVPDAHAVVTGARAHVDAMKSVRDLDRWRPRRAGEWSPSPKHFRPQRRLLDNGMTLIWEHHPGTGTVAAELFVDAGMIRESLPGLAFLTGRMLEEGTRGKSAAAVAEAVEDLGATLDLGATGASIRLRREDFAAVLALLAEILSEPGFPADTLPWVRRRLLAELRGDREDPAFLADDKFRRLIYGRHPHGRDPRGRERAIRAITLDQIHEHHARFFHPENSFLVVVGDLDPATLAQSVERGLRCWKPADSPINPPQIPSIPRRARSITRRIEFPSDQVHCVIGHLGPRRRDPDFDALVVLDHVLGSGPGFTDRLNRVLREELGLVYSVTGGMTDSADLEPGLFRAAFATSPGQLDAARTAMLTQIQAVSRGEILDEEIENSKQYLSHAWLFDYQTVSQRADRLLEIQRWGLPLDEPLTWPARVGEITPEQVRAAAARWIHPETLVIVECGPD